MRNVVLVFANMGIGNWEMGISSYISIQSLNVRSSDCIIAYNCTCAGKLDEVGHAIIAFSCSHAGLPAMD